MEQGGRNGGEICICFANRLNVVCHRKRQIKGEDKVFDLNNWKDGVVIKMTQIDVGRV